MSYENPTHLTLDMDVGTTSRVQTFRLPKGNRGRIRTAIVQNTGTSYNAVTTPATFALGVAGDPARFALIPFGTLGANASIDAAQVKGGIAATPRSLAGVELPADTDILATFTANTGGTPAGSARVSIGYAIY